MMNSRYQQPASSGPNAQVNLTQPHPVVSGKKLPSVLVVDDIYENFDIIENLLASEPYEFFYASSGRQALERMKPICPDIILLDVMMPDMDGIEVCRRIKSNSDWQHIPIIIVTALTDKEDLARCLAAGANDFISKPIHPLELKARMRTMLSIKQHHDQQQELLQAREAMLRLREDMSNSIVHDLRNPLTSILLAAQILKGSDLQEKQLKKVEQIARAGQQLQSLVDSLLVQSKLESGKMVLQRIDTNICNIGRAVIADLELIAAHRQIAIAGEFGASDRKVAVDPPVFRRILDNLLANAIKFSPVGGQVTLRIDFPRGKQVRVEVSDCGPGIREQELPTIFERFETGQAIEGISQIGLGLSFCRTAVRAHGGKISVRRNQPHGAIFTLEI